MATTSILTIFCMFCHFLFCSFFFFNDTATTEIYTPSLHDALPISYRLPATPSARDHFRRRQLQALAHRQLLRPGRHHADRKSTRLNSSHSQISYAVFCLKKKKKSYAIPN